MVSLITFPRWVKESKCEVESHTYVITSEPHGARKFILRTFTARPGYWMNKIERVY